MVEFSYNLSIRKVIIIDNGQTIYLDPRHISMFITKVNSVTNRWCLGIYDGNGNMIALIDSKTGDSQKGKEIIEDHVKRFIECISHVMGENND